LADDLGHGQVLEDALVGAVRQVRQLRAKGHVIAGQALAGFTLSDAVDLPVNAMAGLIEREKGGLVQQALQIQVRTFAGQFQFELEGLTDGFALGVR